MLDHVSLGVTNVDRSRHFYDAVLRPLGLVRIVDFGEGRGSDYGAAPGSLGVEFTITKEAGVMTPILGAHLCFRAPDRAAVDAFHVAAIASRLFAMLQQSQSLSLRGDAVPSEIQTVTGQTRDAAVGLLCRFFGEG